MTKRHPSRARQPEPAPARDIGVWRGPAIIVAVFAVVTLLAELLGAVNLGTALTFGQIAFMATVVALILRGQKGA